MNSEVDSGRHELVCMTESLASSGKHASASSPRGQSWQPPKDLPGFSYLVAGGGSLGPGTCDSEHACSGRGARATHCRSSGPRAAAHRRGSLQSRRNMTVTGMQVSAWHPIGKVSSGTEHVRRRSAGELIAERREQRRQIRHFCLCINEIALESCRCLQAADITNSPEALPAHQPV